MSKQLSDVSTKEFCPGCVNWETQYWLEMLQDKRERIECVEKLALRFVFLTENSDLTDLYFKIHTTLKSLIFDLNIINHEEFRSELDDLSPDQLQILSGNIPADQRFQEGLEELKKLLDLTK